MKGNTAKGGESDVKRPEAHRVRGETQQSEGKKKKKKDETP